VEDWYDAYQGNAVSNPDYGIIHVIRGGSWYEDGSFVGSVILVVIPSGSGFIHGFRSSRSSP